MRADLDLLCISVYCTADDLLPSRPGNGRRKLNDAEIVTLCVAQALMGIPSDRRFLRAAKRQLGHFFPVLPSQDALHKRRARLGDTIEWLSGHVSAQCPGAADDLVLRPHSSRRRRPTRTLGRLARAPTLRARAPGRTLHRRRRS